MKLSHMTDAGCFVFEKVWALPPQRQWKVVPSVSHRIDRPSLLIWEDEHLTSRITFEVIDEHLATFKVLSANNRRGIRELTPSFETTGHTVTAPIQSLISCWRIGVLGLIRTVSCKLSWFTTITSLPLQCLSHLLLDMWKNCQTTRF